MFLKNTYTFYHAVGEVEDNSRKYFLLSTFINDEISAYNFIEDYMKHNKYVNAYVLKSFCKKPPPSSIIKSEDGRDILRPKPVSYRSCLKNLMKYTDEQVSYLETSFEDDAHRYLMMKKIGMEKEVGFFHSVMEYNRSDFEDDTDIDIIDRIRSTIPLSVLGKRKQPEDETSSSHSSPHLPPLTRNNKAICVKEEGGVSNEEFEDMDNEQENNEEHNIECVPCVSYKHNNTILSIYDMKARLNKIYKNDISKKELVKHMIDLSDKHANCHRVVKLLLCYNIFLYKKHCEGEGNIEKGRNYTPSAPVYVDVDPDNIKKSKAEMRAPFGLMYQVNDKYERKEIPTSPYGWNEKEYYEKGIIIPRRNPNDP